MSHAGHDSEDGNSVITFLTKYTTSFIEVSVLMQNAPYIIRKERSCEQSKLPVISNTRGQDFKIVNNYSISTIFY